MSIKKRLYLGVAKFFIERPGRRKSVAEWADALESDGAEIDMRAAAAKNEDKAQRMLRHVSGIERWGQRRLRVFLGEADIMDEYDDYRPATDLSTEEQRANFRSTRQETVALARQLAESEIDAGRKVVHNEFGPLTLRGWLRYLNMHANQEMMKVRKKANG